MGAVVSVLPLIAGAVFGFVRSLQTASSSGHICENPVMDELEQRIQQQHQDLQDALADHAKAEKDRENAEKAFERLEAERTMMEENARQQEEGRIRAEEARKRAEEKLRRADEDRYRAEEQRRQAENDARRANEERARATAEAQRAQQEQEKADQARREAEKAAADARAAREEAEKKLREGIRPIVIPTQAQFRETKLRLQYRKGLFHFAIAGLSGSGKSSLINAFRGLRNKDSDAAPTGVVETTSVITRYPDPNPANPFVWYDVPGAGTLSIPDWQYFTDQGLYIFDCIVVLFDNRFTATDVAILRNCARFQIPTYIVRSKSKQHIQNTLEDMLGGEDADDDAMGTAREQYIRETRASVARNLKVAELPEQQVYMVDKESLVRAVKGKQPREAMDEWVLLRDLLGEARRRRVVE
ncbi:P-loop containing nucleoside triphosphate hydrolase protein [Daedalea quercina L-15889]|uniref:p-loop containing nucleoside triphosphate hydrolase protein n=1 Tax=Daedalea quercina L-15889 TaxID=1314783 RepID=A0A165MUP5_9APHY|nr:P-loop containing nucleoside triphosphate hydrolase protein [Daedalea quercina L-15889]